MPSLESVSLVRVLGLPQEAILKSLPSIQASAVLLLIASGGGARACQALQGALTDCCRLADSPAHGACSVCCSDCTRPLCLLSFACVLFRCATFAGNIKVAFCRSFKQVSARAHAKMASAALCWRGVRVPSRRPVAACP